MNTQKKCIWGGAKVVYVGNTSKKTPRGQLATHLFASPEQQPQGSKPSASSSLHKLRYTLGQASRRRLVQVTAASAWGRSTRTGASNRCDILLPEMSLRGKVGNQINASLQRSLGLCWLVLAG